MKINFISKGEEKELSSQLKKNYGIKKLPYLLFKDRNNNIKGFSGNLTKKELKFFANEFKTEKIGLPLLSKEKDGLRLTFDSPAILNPEKNVIEINEKESKIWMSGESIWPLELDKNLKGYVVLKHNKDYLGSGKISEGKVKNFVPKSRYVKNS